MVQEFFSSFIISLWFGNLKMRFYVNQKMHVQKNIPTFFVAKLIGHR